MSASAPHARWSASATRHLRNKGTSHDSHRRLPRLLLAGHGGLGRRATNRRGQKPQPSQEELEKQFAETMSGATLVGRFTVDGQDLDKPLKEDRYTLGKVSKLKNGLWSFETRIQYGDHDVKLPLALQVKWAGDTPVITLTDVHRARAGHLYRAGAGLSRSSTPAPGAAANTAARCSAGSRSARIGQANREKSEKLTPPALDYSRRPSTAATVPAPPFRCAGFSPPSQPSASRRPRPRPARRRSIRPRVRWPAPPAAWPPPAWAAIEHSLTGRARLRDPAQLSPLAARK